MSDPTDDAPPTQELLARWHRGDRTALETLLAQDMPWIRNYVHHRLGDLLRRRGETQDYVHEAMIRILEYGPRFITSDRGRFRALLAKIIENQLRDQCDWHGAQRRAPARERPLPTDSVLDLDRAARSVTRPSEAAARTEARDWIHLALELIDPGDREIIILRQWQERSYPEIAEHLGIAEDTARMRFHRALGRLGRKVESLRRGAT